MKKYLLGLMAVVVALGLSAFTGESKKVVVKGTANLHWFEPPYANGDFQATTTSVSQRTGQIDCSEVENDECERGYLDNQFVTPGVPSSGFKTDEQLNPAATIYLED